MKTPPEIRVPEGLSPAQQARYLELAKIDRDQDPAELEKACLESLGHEESFVSAEEILKRVDVILRDKQSA
ncbi:MAG: hypothetical protein U0793_20450 [Gemmataceae bacterium]